MGIGNVLSSSLQQQAAQPPGGAPAAGAAAAAGGMPDVMTPAEAAEFLKVAAEDVVAAIEAGDLQARKIGSAYRISKDALQAFLNG